MFSTFSFDGYRGFPSRRLLDPKAPLQCVELAPLTVLLGQNNAGKSSVLALLAQVQQALGATDGVGLPLSLQGRTIAADHLQLLPSGDRLNLLTIEAAVEVPDGPAALRMELSPLGQLDALLWGRALSWGGRAAGGLPAPLVSPLPEMLPLAANHRAWLSAAAQDSVWLGPLRARAPDAVPLQPQRAAGALVRHDGGGSVEAMRTYPLFFAKVQAWFKEHVDLKLRWDDDLRSARLLCRAGAADWTPLVDAGAGVHQLLPVVCLACWRALGNGEPGHIDLIEQPELHLHDALHPALADLLLGMSAAGGRVVVETHSEGLLLRLRRRVAEGGVNASDVALYFVDRDAGTGADAREVAAGAIPSGSSLRRVGLQQDGEVTGWPEGVFLETFDEVALLRKAQRLRRARELR
jgi:hypothetical protein